MRGRHMEVAGVVLGLVGLACAGTGGGGNTGAGPMDGSAAGAGDGGGTADGGMGADAGLPQPLLQGIWPLSSADPMDADVRDLQALDTTWSAAQVVGIGEAMHTSAGFFDMRMRLVSHLVSRHGFRLLAFESSWTPVAQTLETYLQTCMGGAPQATQALHSIWWDQNVPPFLEGLCRFNEAHRADPVHALGFDIRQPWTDRAALASLFQQGAPQDAQMLTDGLATCLGAGHSDEQAFFMDPVVRGYYGGTPMPQAPHDACQQGVAAVVAYLEDHNSSLVASTSSRAVTLARLSAVGMGAFDMSIYMLSHGDAVQANAARDVAMLDVLMTLRALDHPGAKVAIWAHNGHIMEAADQLVNSQWTGVPSLGTQLGTQLGNAYVSVGQIAYQLQYNWLQGSGELPTPSLTSLEATLEPYGLPFLLVDTAQAVAMPQPALPDIEQDVGFDQMRAAQHYDVIIWHHQSRAAVYFADPGF